ncbi:phosphonopyruvate decarboxylase-like [Bacillus rossius redtenbacheri]|uniref:phosphonopyruvate decarboxylase-like n=1 Tax=Bacillus rossius redtenbacheri TaxID=93214 RepID=UPI002FDD9D7D
MFSMQSLVVALRSGLRHGSPLLRPLSTLADLRSPHELQIHEQTKRNEESAHLTELIRDFLNPSEFYQALRNIDIEFFCGVPDSLLKDFCAFVTHCVPETHHVIAANEGSAVGLATGYHLASGRTGLVYLQNSGLGNTVNPLLSLAAPEVYSVPMLLLIGWRGEPGKRDEPQHMLQGQVTPGMLNSLGIPFSTLPDFIDGAKVTLDKAKMYMDRHSCPYALLVKRQTFLPYKLPKTPPQFPMTREQALHGVLAGLTDRDAVVSTTGMVSRELFEHRVAHEQGHERDFLTVGSMGHAASIALGIALCKPSRQVFCLDGDGSVIMHMGTLSTVGQLQPPNLKHVVINNGTHDSVGGQPTAAANHDRFSVPRIALASGYLQSRVATTEDELEQGMAWLHAARGPVLLEVKVRSGSRKELGRPTRSPIQNKMDFMNFLALRSYDH